MVHFIFKDARKIRDEAHVARMTSLAFGCALRVLVCGFQPRLQRPAPEQESKAAASSSAPQPGDAISPEPPRRSGLGTLAPAEVREPGCPRLGGGTDVGLPTLAPFTSATTAPGAGSWNAEAGRDSLRAAE